MEAYSAIMKIQIPEAYTALFEPKRYKILSGGRGSWQVRIRRQGVVDLRHAGKRENTMC